MLRSYLLSLGLLLLGSSSVLFGQNVPNGMSYQAIARELGGGEIVNQTLTVKIGILEGTVDGTLLFEELHTVTTNPYGLFTLVIGQGVPSGNAPLEALTDISWSAGPHFMRVDVDTPFSTGFEFLGVTQLLTVPYAYHAMTADSAPEQDGDAANEIITALSLNGQTLSVTEGTHVSTVDLSTLSNPIVDLDPDPANEVISNSLVTPTTITITEGSTVTELDVSPVAFATWSESADAVYNTTQSVGIGTATPSSTLEVQGSLATHVVKFTGLAAGGAENFDLSAIDCVAICDVSDGDIRVNLPSASTCAGRQYTIRRFFSQATSTAYVELKTTGGDTIDGQSSKMLSHSLAEYATVISDGTAWYIISHSKE
jgi:hypothetical protein